MSEDGRGQGRRESAFPAQIRPVRPSGVATSPAATGQSVTAGRPARVGETTISGPTAPAIHVSRLVTDAVGVALTSLDALTARAHHVASAFRSDDVQGGQRSLAELVHGTQILLQLAAMAAKASATDLAALERYYGTTACALTESSVNALIERQFDNNWPGLADVLDGPFRRALAQWRFVFETLSGSPDGDEAA